MTIQYAPLSPVVVTGAASGIGRACAEALAEVGRPVALWDVNDQAVDKAANQIRKRFAVEAVPAQVDVADLDQIHKAAKTARETLGPVGSFVHAAGVDGTGPLAELSPERWQSIMDINLRAYVFIAQALLEDLKQNPGSAIVGIASINATLGNAANPTYSASKGGTLSVTRALADDLSGQGIRINTVSPGQIATPMIQNALDQAPGLEEAFKHRIFLGRLGEPKEVAKAVRFLLSEEASYVTGTELVVDGGNIPSQR